MKALSSCSNKPWPLLCVTLWGIFVFSGAPTLLLSQPSDKPSGAEQKAIKRNIDLLPLRFEPNEGQSSSDAQFLAQGRGFSALFKENEADFLFAGHAARKSGHLRLTLVNASRNVAVSGEKRLPGTVNYFIGNDRENWHTGLPTFQCLRYTSVYPGTDLVYYGNNGNLEFDFRLFPGAAPSQIQMRFEGARSLRIDGKGDLIVTANDGHISFQKPVIYQLAEGGKRDPIEGDFKILEKDTVGFVVDGYDRTRPLIIDPILNYSTYIGPLAEATSIVVDQNGEAYVTGLASLEFPTTPSSYQPVGVVSSTANTFPGDSRPFVAKFNSAGTALLYSTFLSGSGIDDAYGIALDANGDAFVVGTTSSTDFPITTGAFETINNASETTGFVTELNNSGSSLIYSTYLGGSTSTSVIRAAIDASGNAYLAGATQDTNFPTTPGAYRTTALTKATAGVDSAFVAKLNPTGTALVYSTYLGGSGADASFAIVIDGAGEAYVGGDTTSIDFPVTVGALQNAREASNTQAGFVTKLNALGTALVYSTYLSGNAVDNVNSIAIDPSGDVFATGSTTSADFPVTAGAFQSNIGITTFGYPQTNAFVTELNGAGTALVYSTFLGGNISLYLADQGDGAAGIALDGQGMVYLTGSACTTDFPVTTGALESNNLDMLSSQECTAFLTKMNPVPSAPLLYSTFFGGSGNEDAVDEDIGDGAIGLALDPTGNVYLAGYTASVDFPTTAGVVETAFTGPNVEAIVAEFNGSEIKTLPIPTVTLTSNTSSVFFGQPVTFTATVQPASGDVTPTGYVGFNFLEPERSDIYGTGVGMGPWTTTAINSVGVATFTTSSLVVLQTPVNAFYLGDANNAPAVGSMTQTVKDISTITTVTSSADNVVYDTPVIFTATVLDEKGNPAKGFVFFLLGDISYAEPDLDSAGQATWTNGTGGPPLPVGTDTVEVEYFPYTGYLASSGTIAETFTGLGSIPDPTFAPPAGTYTSTQNIALADSNPAAHIYYTTDGSTPVPDVSPEFSPGNAIPVDASQTINAIAVVTGYTPSNVVSAAYTINLPPPGFTTGPGATTSMIVTAGSTSGNTGTASVVGTNGFSGTVDLTCAVTSAMTGVNDMPTCSVSPTSVNISGNNAQTSTLTVNTTPPSSADNRVQDLFWTTTGGTTIALTMFIITPRRRRSWVGLATLLVILAAVGLTSCSGSGGSGGGGGGGGNSGTTLGSYTITVTGTSAGMSTTVGTVALTVQ